MQNWRACDRANWGGLGLKLVAAEPFPRYHFSLWKPASCQICYSQRWRKEGGLLRQNSFCVISYFGVLSCKWQPTSSDMSYGRAGQGFRTLESSMWASCFAKDQSQNEIFNPSRLSLLLPTFYLENTKYKGATLWHGVSCSTSVALHLCLTCCWHTEFGEVSHAPMLFSALYCGSQTVTKCQHGTKSGNHSMSQLKTVAGCRKWCGARTPGAISRSSAILDWIVVRLVSFWSTPDDTVSCEDKDFGNHWYIKARCLQCCLQRCNVEMEHWDYYSFCFL